ncbi:multicopper oxidase, types 2 and 3 [Cylindrospermum sp. NIES-4074]|nr:multicopper oxidase, types 2 and 3 [Cylindrospermum sp. NIES-4074]
MIFTPIADSAKAETASIPPCSKEGIAKYVQQRLNEGIVEIPAESYFKNPPEIKSNEEGVLETSLEVKYGYNSIAGCPVYLRSYNGQLVGPTLRVKPENTINIKLINNLPVNPRNKPLEDDNIPHDFNTTNFHTHGLHVSPKEFSDNVLVSIIPNSNPYPISIKLPKGHPGGTHWYHPHKHGSTAIQVSSGMEGAILVEDQLDQDLQDHHVKAEKIFVFQQISYDDNGKLEDYKGFGFGQGASNWSLSKRRTTINGQVIPVIKMQSGEVQRWRLIHGGIRETIQLGLEKKADGTRVKLHEIAVDGITLGKVDSWDKLELEPGYRSDVLVQAPEVFTSEPEEYRLVDKATTAENSLLKVAEDQHTLARVLVYSKNTLESLSVLFDNGKPSSELLSILKEARTRNTGEHGYLRNIEDGEIKGHQEIAFNIFSRPGLSFTINGKSFTSKDPQPVSLKLGTADEWRLMSGSANHPFHVHVNPFQYTRKDPQGGNETIWRDTLMVKANEPVTIRSRYEDFDGDFLLHCHILDHEDQGMMKLVSIKK